MGHRLFPIASAASLSLCLTVLPFCVWRAVSGPYGVSFRTADGSIEFFELPPNYALPIGFGILPAVWLAVRVYNGRSQRHVQGYCAACGYDLTGNQSGLCPECGTVIRADE